MGRYDESLCYLVLGKQLLSNFIISNHASEDLVSMLSSVLGIISASTLDQQERYYFYNKGRRLSLKPFDLHKLLIFFSHGEIAQKMSPEAQWDLNSVIQILNEGEELLKDIVASEEYKLGQFLIIWAHRAAAYWKAGLYELSMDWSAKVTQLSFDNRLRLYHPSVMISIVLVTKLHIYSENVLCLEQNLKMLLRLEEHFPFIKTIIHKVKSVLARYNLCLYEDDPHESDSHYSICKFFEIPSWTPCLPPPEPAIEQIVVPSQENYPIHNVDTLSHLIYDLF
jgi:hypothetical protein